MIPLRPRHFRSALRKAETSHCFWRSRSKNRGCTSLTLWTEAVEGFWGRNQLIEFMRLALTAEAGHAFSFRVNHVTTVTGKLSRCKLDAGTHAFGVARSLSSTDMQLAFYGAGRRKLSELLSFADHLAQGRRLVPCRCK